MIGCRPLTDAEIDSLAERADVDIRARCLILIGATTGFRISELLSLKVQDFHNGPRVYVHKQSTKGKSQGRSAFISPEAMQAVEALAYAERLQGSDWLFKSRVSEKPLDRVRAHRLLKAAFTKLGLQGKVATHSMRKYFAQQVYEGSGKDIIATKAALGHKSLDSTAAYLSFQTDKLDSIVSNMRRTKVRLL